MRQVVFSIALFFSALAVALFLGEVAMRLVAPQQLILVRPDVWRAVDTLGWAKRPGLRTTINTGERTVDLVTDSLGFRVGTQGRPAATGGEPARILLLGDSFMEALQVDYEQSLAGLLERELEPHAGAPVEVWNTGVAGWGPSQYLLMARRLLGRVPFHYVLVALYVGNDAVLEHHEYVPPREPTVVHRLRFPRGFSVAEWRDALLYPVNDFLERRSHLFVAFKTASENLRARLGLGGPELPFEIRRRQADSPRWSVTADIARDLADLAARHGTPTTFVLLPSAYQVDTAVAQAFTRTFDLDPSEVDLEQPNRLLAREMTARGLRVIDALPRFRAAHAEGMHVYGTVDEHLSPEGHAVLVELVIDGIGRDVRMRVASGR